VALEAAPSAEGLVALEVPGHALAVGLEQA